jgi:hypothetical protein
MTFSAQKKNKRHLDRTQDHSTPPILILLKTNDIHYPHTCNESMTGATDGSKSFAADDSDEDATDALGAPPAAPMAPLAATSTGSFGRDARPR